MQKLFNKIGFPVLLIAAVLIFALAALYPSGLASAEDAGPFIVSNIGDLTDAADEAAAGDFITLGANISIGADLTIPAGVTLTVPVSYTLEVQAGATLNITGDSVPSNVNDPTIKGDFVLNGELSVRGSLVIGGAVTLGDLSKIDLGDNEDVTLCGNLYAKNNALLATEVEFPVGIDKESGTDVRWQHAGEAGAKVLPTVSKYPVKLVADSASIRMNVKITVNNISISVKLFYANPSTYVANPWQAAVASSAIGNAGEQMNVAAVLSQLNLKSGYHFLHATLEGDEDPNNHITEFTVGTSNNSVIIKLYFGRDKYNVKLTTADPDAAGEEGFITKDGEIREFELGDTVSLTDPAFAEIFTKVGYKLSGWREKLKTYKVDYRINGAVSSEPVEGKENTYLITLSAVFEAATDIPYKVERYLLEDRNADKSGAELLTESTHKGTTGTTPKIQTDYVGYSFVSAGEDLASVAISGDGTTLVKLYYVIVKHTVSYSDSDTAPQEYRAGAEVTLPAAPAPVEGKTFNGWLVNGTLYQAGATFTMPAGSVTVRASYSSSSVTVPETGAQGGNNNIISVWGGNDGLSAGAIAGMVIGSAAALSIAAFAVIWFAVKKKSFGDLAKLFKLKK